MIKTSYATQLKRKLSFCLILILLILAAETGKTSAFLKVYFFDVGQAEATLLMGSDFTVLIDGGDRGKSDVVGYLESLGVQQLDLLLLTHPHADHIGQAAAILAAVSVEEVWMSGYEHTTKLFSDVLDAVIASDAYYTEPRRGETYHFGDLRLEVLNPDYIGSDLHHTNIVIRALYGDVAFLFTGDAELKTEESILANEASVTAQILQLGHHGSRTSSGIEFVLAVEPQIAVYSAGENNIYGHPHAEVVARLQGLGIPLYGTDVHGTILVQTDGVGFTINVTKNPHLPGGAVEINTAEAQHLRRIMHIGGQRAQEIIRLREESLFADVTDLSRVAGLGKQRIAEIKDQGLAFVKE